MGGKDNGMGVSYRICTVLVPYLDRICTVLDAYCGKADKQMEDRRDENTY